MYANHPQFRRQALDQLVSVHLYGPARKDEQENLCNKIQGSNIHDIIQIHDAVVGEEKQKVLFSADCFIQTSRSEGMSMGVLEALGIGLPCILTEGTGMVDEINKYNAGWGCQTDVDSIRTVLRQVVKERFLIEEKSQNAKKMIEKNYSWDNIAKLTIQKYKQILKR